ncbi:MAG: 16S rRNA (adenine(1518)-N(6)/adenine(1519)-N(6))-dimethyltransferase RsmA [bacterium]|nr:16S rRNA (adenine(1518)-N(6)/adenine(1519)-N(6))-dimethyltransferase RsmA [bacterium]
MKNPHAFRGKRLGQHFLTSPAVLAKIIAAAKLSPDETVLEVGPGTGVLTRALAARARRVIAVEKDAELCRSLGDNLKKEGVSNVRLIRGDILKIPLEDLALPERYAVVANIPYYLTSRLIRTLLESRHPPTRMLLMVQREVADRICTRPPKMNLLALSVQAYGKPKILFRVPALAFSPSPEVDSAFIEIGNINASFFTNHRISPEFFFRTARAAFQGKRKMLENSISHNLKLPKASVREALVVLRLSKKRPEELAAEDWARLYRALGPEVET